MSKKVLEGVIPPGGFHFPDNSGGTEVRIEGYSIPDVAANVLRYRMANNRPPGNPFQELIDYICNAWPHFCMETDSGEIPHAGLPEPLSRRCAAWMASWFSTVSDDPGVPQAEADRRAAVCAGCPNNKDHEAGGCGACTAQVARLSFIYRRNRQTPSDAQLRCCDLFDSPLQATVWSAKLPAATEDQRARKPVNCWRQ